MMTLHQITIILIGTLHKIKQYKISVHWIIIVFPLYCFETLQYKW